MFEKGWVILDIIIREEYIDWKFIKLNFLDYYQWIVTKELIIIGSII